MQRGVEVACGRLSQQQVCNGSTEHVYLEPEVIILPDQHFSRNFEQPQDQRCSQRNDHFYEEAEAVNLSVRRNFPHMYTRHKTILRQRKDNLSSEDVYREPEPVSFPLQDFSVTICDPGASTIETSFSVSPEEVYEEAQPVNLQDSDAMSSQADSHSGHKNDKDEEKEKLQCDRRCHITSCVCVARTTVVMVTLIITGAALLLSVWHQKQDDVTALPLLTTAAPRNVSVTLGADSVDEALPDLEMTSTQPSRLSTSKAFKSTVPVPSIQTTENILGLEPYLKTPDCAQELVSAKEEEKASAPAVHCRIAFGKRGSGPGEFNWASGVVVSPSNKIFVADVNNRRVQVHNMSGAHLYMFPTVLPDTGNQFTRPYGITIDSDGYLWVIGRPDKWRNSIAQYTAGGCVKAAFSTSKPGVRFRGVAIDRQSNNIIVTGRNTWPIVVVLRRDGAVLHTAHAEQSGCFESVAVDNEDCIMYPGSGRSPDGPRTPQGVLYSTLPHLVNADGKHLFCKYWEPKEQSPRMLMMICHGYAEHCLRYEQIAGDLSKEGILVFSHDHVGHGQSEGRRADVTSFHEYVRDVLQHVDKVRAEHPGLPVFILGHSMGGAITALAAMERPDLFSGVILSGAMIIWDPNLAPSCFLVWISKPLAAIFPRLKVRKIDSRLITSDPAQAKAYADDRLIYHDAATVRQSVQMFGAMTKILDNAATFNPPVLILHGEEDRINSPEGSRVLYENCSSADKQLKLYPGLFHEILNESPEEAETVRRDIVTWVTDRMPAR
ncbi:MGLL [Branchiostoma lanceolatum]|uniref:MGLL protein n=1 Tax=Branchiostoma lanceolatum TaxID=7740 RepID=A0A8K0E3T4_BRALA|nr:MGLL [Branchiostoma lanceolatum]